MLEKYDIAGVDRGEVLRYMGYAGQAYDPSLDETIDRGIRRAIEVSTPMASWLDFEVVAAHDAEGGTLPWVELGGCALKLEGRDIVRHLRGARRVAVFAVTLGMPNERELRRLSLVDRVTQVTFDAASSALVERAADATEARVMKRAGELGLHTNSRFSPGYGDMPLTCQPTLLATVGAARLGITLSPSLLMTPTKSVTAVMGMFDEPQPSGRRGCATCACRDFCFFRSRGITCYGS